ncbi:MarR family EPS-associated transcriptional regulator [Candidatus Thiodictyon syntrophicum]|jgi:EPS-associated MarR family transcriptional regulator|uniref:MarR family EPS-associated transcriptional regulator n=2 Tax=Candidatus Thiodictyon syntrophicum TaxID=1166950 RepID=A0A2K8UEE7_9GAMM|nr:MarR family EPS-associated transcriptional regulator [Candidatus Thiodictyon syntrophicum]
MRYRLLKHLSEQPQASQRQLSEILGVSVGSLNDCVNALIERGWVKVTNFRNSRNKLAYAYFLTPSGIEAKTRIAMCFLQRKLEEYAARPARRRGGAAGVLQHLRHLRRTGTAADRRAPPVVDCTGLVHPTMPGGRNYDQGPAPLLDDDDYPGSTEKT